MKVKKRNIIIALFAAVCILLVSWILCWNIDVETEKVIVKSGNIPIAFDGFKIVQISDLHNVEFGKNNIKLLKLLKESDADIIVITGDMIDARRTDIDCAVSLAKEAVKIAPTYYACGNHEARIPKYEGFKEELIKNGVRVLEDESLQLAKDKEELTVIGMIDPAFYSKEDDVQRKERISDQLLKIIPEDDSYKLLLAHRPELFEDYVEHGVDLVFSGHAHGGQFVLPFFGGVFAPGQGFFPEYYNGLYTKDDTSMIVSPGLGNSLMPFRINNKPKIMVAELDRIGD